MEGLIAFFFESTFLGLWIFGWTRLPKLVHLACIWIVALAVNMSAYFIIAANSFMQHPVGAHYNPDTRRAELTSIVALLTNNTAIAAFTHVVAGSLLTAGTFVAAISAWWMVRTHRSAPQDARALYRPATKLGAVVALLAAVALLFTGDAQGKLMFVQQPMKMASAESLCATATDPDFSILTVGTHNNCDSVTHLIAVPSVLPWLAKGQASGVRLEGVKDLQAQAEKKYGPGDYRPNLFVTYWSFRLMIGLLAIPAAFALCALWLTRHGRVADHRWLKWLGLVAIPTPFLANTAGWVFTEMGRQPWIVAPNPTGDPLVHLTVAQGVSDHPAAMVVVSLTVFTVIYAALGVVWFWLMRRYVVEGPQEHDAEPIAAATEEQPPTPLSFAY